MPAAAHAVAPARPKSAGVLARFLWVPVADGCVPETRPVQMGHESGNQTSAVRQKASASNHRNDLTVCCRVAFVPWAPCRRFTEHYATMNIQARVVTCSRFNVLECSVNVLRATCVVAMVRFASFEVAPIAADNTICIASSLLQHAAHPAEPSDWVVLAVCPVNFLQNSQRQ